MQNYAYDDLGQLLTWTRFPGTGSQAAEVYAYDSVGNRVGLSYQNYLGATTSWRTYDIGRRTDTSKGPNQLLKSLGRNAMVVFNYNTFGYDPDGAQVERKLYTGSNMLIESETFGYSSWRGLNTGYTKSVIGPNTLNWEWRYRYNAMGEREQKRETSHPGLDSTASNGYKWSYYLLGGSKEQLSLWEGLQTRDTGFCSHPGSGSYVHLYPSEYLVYGVEYPGVREDVPRLRLLPDSSREYRITDHLASVRTTLDETGTITKTYEYKPFGGLFMGSGEARQSFNSREKDQEAGVYNNGVRKLDDDEARFTSIDPLWEDFDPWTPYQYGYNNPLRMTDPTGLQAAPVAGPDMPSPLGLTKEELAQARDHPIAATHVFDNAQTATDIANERANRLGGGVANGPADAFRHALWSAMNVRDVGVVLAKEFGDLHEQGKNFDVAESAMDLHNNAVGYSIGVTYPNATDEQLADIVEKVLLSCNLLQTSLGVGSTEMQGGPGSTPVLDVSKSKK